VSPGSRPDPSDLRAIDGQRLSCKGSKEVMINNGRSKSGPNWETGYEAFWKHNQLGALICSFTNPGYSLVDRPSTVEEDGSDMARSSLKSGVPSGHHSSSILMGFAVPASLRRDRFRGGTELARHSTSNMSVCMAAKSAL